MPSAAEYQKRISQYGWKELSGLWDGIKSGSTPGWPRGTALEYLILHAFRLSGALVRWPYEVPLWDEGEVVEQIDGTVHAHGLHCLIECKDWETPVNIEPIAKLRNQLLRRPAGTAGIVFARGGFTDPAIQLAQFTTREGILLWCGQEIGYVLREENIVDALHAKHRACVEMAYPFFNVAVKGVL